MSSAASNLVNKVWNYCNLLRDDGVSYGDYVEQLTYLLFLKMDYERTRPPYNRKSTIPEDYNWASLIEMDGLPLERHYAILSKISAKSRASSASSSGKPRTRSRTPPTCAVSLSTSSIRNLGAR
jgi:type I restriction enzyme M protein